MGSGNLWPVGLKALKSKDLKKLETSNHSDKITVNILGIFYLDKFSLL
jgi:hypothetical protein